MKNSILFALLIVSRITIAQLGINTQSLSGIFHIDASSNNKTGISTKSLDDIVITNSGKVGIGTDSPQVKLEIVSNNKPALKITDGNEGYQKRFISDSNGVGKWGISKNITDWIKPVDLLGITPIRDTPTYSGKSITLPKGTWLVKYNLLWYYTSSGLSLKPAYIDVILCTSNQTFNNTSIIPGSWVISVAPPGSNYVSSQNSIVYTVKNTSETLYLWSYFNGYNPSAISNIISYNPMSTIMNNTFEAIRWR